MFDRKKLAAAFRDLDATACENAVGPGGFPDAHTAQGFLEELRHSGCLALKRPDRTSEGKRDSLVAKCRVLLSASPSPSVVGDFDTHVEDARVAERCFREILTSLKASPAWQLAPEVQAWGVIRASLELLHELADDIDGQRAELAASGRPLDVKALRISGEGGSETTPDAFLDCATQSVGATLPMLGYIHRWFDVSTGELLLPVEQSLEQADRDACKLFVVLAAAWRAVENAWDCCRFFDRRLRIRQRTMAQEGGAQRAIQCAEADPPQAEVLFDRIATNRLLSMFLNQQMDIAITCDTDRIVQSPASGPVPLPLSAFISREELVTATMMLDTFCLPLDDDSQLFEGLPLRVWLRGYAYYAYLATTGEHGNPLRSFLRLTRQEILDGLVGVGLTAIQAEKFVRLTSFQQGSLDLYDAPLMRSADGCFHFWAPAYCAPMLALIVLSRIGALNRRRGDDGQILETCSFDDKGKRFEKSTVEKFRQVGLCAHSFKYKIDGVQYDCDCAVLLDDVLFVFECKNYSLAFGHISSLYYHSLSMESAGKQVQRIAEQLAEHPQIVKRHFGEEATWARAVPCVLQALPWSAGLLGDVCFYDSSALSRFLQEGVISTVLVGGVGAGYALRRHHYPLRKGDIPTAEELLRQLESPAQLRLEKVGWQIAPRRLPINNELLLSVPEWQQRAATVEERMVALGSSPGEAARRAKELTEEFPATLGALKEQMSSRERGEEPTPSSQP